MKPLNKYHNSTKVQLNGPYCVEIQGSHIWTERGLPLFDTIQQAQSFAIARMNIMRSMDEKSGIILVTTPNGDQIQTCTWDTYSSTVVSYADGRGNFFS